MFIKISQSDWYREAQRCSGLTPKRFAANALISVALMVALAAFCLAANL